MGSNNLKTQKIVIAYIPVFHNGYRRFLNKYKNSELFILGSTLIKEFNHLAKEIRALDPETVQSIVKNLKLFKKVSIIEKDKIGKLIDASRIAMPNEEVMRELAEKYFPGKKIIFDDVFLLWDKHNSTKENQVKPKHRISKEEFDKKFSELAAEEANKSSDWWRRVGAVIVKDGKAIIITRNQHLPSSHTPYFNGDPRNNFHKGDHIEISTSIHAEASAIASAARQGISLQGASMYVSTFPCPPCAKLIAYSGIKKLYYAGGYGVLDGEDILKSKGIEIIYVDMPVQAKRGLGYIKYKKK